MVIAKDADTHTLVSRDFPEFRDIDIIQVFHHDRSFVRLVVCRIADFNRDVQVLKALDGLFAQAASLGSPEFDAGLQFSQIVSPAFFRQGGEQKFHERLPGMSRRKFGRLPSHGIRVSVYGGEVYAVHASDHASPCVGIDSFIEVKAFGGFTDERACYTLFLQTDSGLVVQVVEFVVVPSEFSVGSPYVRRFPVIDGIQVIYVIIYFRTPAVIMIQ